MTAALQYEILVDERVPSDRAVSGMAVGSVIVFATLLALNVLALPFCRVGRERAHEPAGRGVDLRGAAAVLATLAYRLALQLPGCTCRQGSSG